MSVPVRDVTAVVVTRGDVDLTPTLEALIFRDVIIWDNAGPVKLRRDGVTFEPGSVGHSDLGAYGRYKAIERVATPVVFFVDDDCVVSAEAQLCLLDLYEDEVLISNMDPNHNGGDYPLLALPGWGSLCRRDLPELAFRRWREAYPDDYGSDDFLRIGCDIIFPVMTPSVMIDLGHENLPHAHAASRTWRRPDYAAKKRWYYDRAAALR